MNTQPLDLSQRFRLSRFFQGEPPVAGAITLNQRRIFILPTGRGLGFVLLILLLGLIAFVYNNNLAYFLTFLLAAVFFVTILHTYKSLAGLTVHATSSQPVFVGDYAHFNLTMLNSTRDRRYAVEVGFKQSEYQLVDLEAEQGYDVPLSIKAQRRGWLKAGTVVIASRYPLGLFRAWSPLRFEQSVLVYPTPASTPLPFPDTKSDGPRQGTLRAGDDEFHGLKRYEAGDAIRKIHWKAYARGLPLQSKQYASEGGNECWLDYARTPGADVEERLGRLCRWLLDAEQNGLRYGLILPQLTVPLDQGQAHLSRCLEQLALF